MIDTGITTGRIGAALGVTSQTVINWMEGGKLPFFRIMSGPRRCKASVLLQFIRDNYQPGVVPKAFITELENTVAAEGQAESAQAEA